jgi:hypothetical protein
LWVSFFGYPHPVCSFATRTGFGLQQQQREGKNLFLLFCAKASEVPVGFTLPAQSMLVVPIRKKAYRKNRILNPLALEEKLSTIDAIVSSY